MTLNERNDILQSTEYIGKVRIAFCDWLEYWSVVGTSGIADETIRENTDMLIHLALSNPEAYVTKLAILAISEPAVRDAVEVTDANVSTAVTNLLTYALQYLL